MKKPIISLCILLFILISPAVAGWKIVTVMEGNGYGQETVMYFQDNKMKVLIGDEIEYIYDLNTEKLIMISGNAKAYWEGTLEGLVNEMKEMMKNMMKQMGMDESEMENTGSEMEVPAVSIVRKDNTFESAGYEGTLYQVWVGEDLQEEMWLCDDIDLTKEFDMAKLMEFSSNMQQMGGSQTEYSDADEYIELYEKGFSVKTVNYTTGQPVTSVLKEASRMNIDASEFEIPPAYTKVDLMELMGNMGEGR